MHAVSQRTNVAFHLLLRFKVIAALLVLSTSAYSGELKVIEMFTSQGCYSCPPADKLLGEMASKDKDILNLEFHVDYWNKLQYRSQGNWEDPYSSAEYTQRQRQYSALNLRGENGVYTPQAVINGIYGHVGSNKRALKAGLNIDSPRPVAVSIGQGDDNTLDIRIDNPSDQDAQIFLVSYLKKTLTNITSGENHDKIMENHNVVTEMRLLGSLQEVGDKPISVAYVAGDNRGCAVLVQPARQGAILGAARCP